MRSPDFFIRLPLPIQVLFSAVGLLFLWAGVSTFFEDMNGLVTWLQEHIGGIWLLIVAAVSLFFGLAPSVIQVLRKRGARKSQAQTTPESLALQPGVVTYANQAAMKDAGFDYDTTFANPKVERIKIAVMVGDRLADMEDTLLGKLEKLTLAEPDSKLLEYLFTLRGSADKLQGAKKRIGNVAERCRVNEDEIAVAFHPLLAFQCLIAYRHDGASWARWETILPAKTPGYWPSHIVKREDNPGVFNYVVESFEKQHAYAVNS